MTIIVKRARVAHQQPLLSSARPASSQPKLSPHRAWKAPAARLPSLCRLQQLNEKWKLELDCTELTSLQKSMGSAMACYQRVADLSPSAPSSPVRYPRTPGYRPDATENELNAWYYKTEISRPCLPTTESKAQLLRGKSIAIKDCIAVAGVPMMNGSRILEGYTPEFDASVVTRVLDAGGTIVGKAVAEDLCCSGSSFATAYGPVRNPWNHDYAAGGSSSGCAALIGGGEVDMALGTDQGGSIRIPAAWCGAVGLKPTFGLVPYTGVCSHEYTVDHVGPMAGTVENTALLLEAIAGYDDGMDTRQEYHRESPPKYSRYVNDGVRGLRIGVLREGLMGCEGEVKEATIGAVQALEQAGATVEHVSIPLHSDSGAIWLPLCLEGGHATRMLGAGAGLHHRGWYPVSLMQAYARGFACNNAELTYTNKFYILLGEYMRETYGYVHYAKAQNLSLLLRQTYKDVLRPAAFDLLVMPTLPLKPLRLLPEGADAGNFIAQAWCMLQNTAAADLTGQPAVSVCCGRSKQDSLPHGIQIVGRHMNDLRVLQAARVIERESRNRLI